MARSTLRVGAAATAAGVKIQTLHYYERRGLLRPRARTASGYREYGEAEIRRVRAIKRAQTLGFTLEEIRELMDLPRSHRSTRFAGERARRKIAEIDERIRDLRRMRRSLLETVECCECGGDLSRCAPLDDLVDGARSQDR